MKKFFIYILIVVLLCFSICMGGCTENHIDDFTTSLNQTNEVKDTENTTNTTEKKHSASETHNVQNYYQMWCDGEITADELMSKPGVMDNFIERIKRFTGYDLYNENFTWKYVAAEDRYPFKFTITYEDDTKTKGIEAIVIRYKDGEDIKYSVEVNPNIIFYLSDSESYFNMYQGILNNNTLFF